MDTDTDTYSEDLPVGELPTGEITYLEDAPAIKLGDSYDTCLLGSTIRGRYAYSLKRLIERETINRRCDPETAERAVAEEIVEIARTYGSNSPEFIDDTLLDTEPRIVIPTR